MSDDIKLVYKLNRDRCSHILETNDGECVVCKMNQENSTLRERVRELEGKLKRCAEVMECNDLINYKLIFTPPKG